MASYPLHSVPMAFVLAERESGCLATSHLHGLPNQQGQHPFRLGELCCAVQGAASDMQSLVQMWEDSPHCRYLS